jgi:hypothetical protein
LWRFVLASVRGDWARRQHIAHMLELSPSRFRVGVDLRLRVPMACCGCWG